MINQKIKFVYGICPYEDFREGLILEITQKDNTVYIKTSIGELIIIAYNFREFLEKNRCISGYMKADWDDSRYKSSNGFIYGFLHLNDST